MIRERWKNWAGNLHSCSEVLAPRNLDDLCKAVKSTAGCGRRVRAAGGGYSWAPLVPNRDAIIRLDGLDRILDFDDQNGTVEAECGVRVKDLTRAAAERNLTVVTP